MPETITEAFDCPCKRKNEPVSSTKIIGNHAADHDHELSRVKPEELLPRIFWPPMLLHFLNKTVTQQGFVDHMDDVGGDHEPQREDQRNVHCMAPHRWRKRLLSGVPLR